MAKKKRKIKVNLRQSSQYYDYNLLVSVILLTCFGLIMLYSSSAYSAQIKFGSDMYYFKKQAAISAGCLIIAIVASRVDYHVYAMFSGWIYLIANVLLFLTKFLGTELNGAKRWIYLGPLSFQPAESKSGSYFIPSDPDCEDGKEYEILAGILGSAVIRGTDIVPDLCFHRESEYSNYHCRDYSWSFVYCISR